MYNVLSAVDSELHNGIPKLFRKCQRHQDFLSMSTIVLIAIAYMIAIRLVITRHMWTVLPLNYYRIVHLLLYLLGFNRFISGHL